MLYRPSYMLPSSVAGGASGVIDVTRQSTFTAQLNASTWIDAYQLVIRQNTADNTVVYDTGVVELDDPFYPTDSMGNYVPLQVTIPASSAPLEITGVTLSSDFKTAWINFNMPIMKNIDLLQDGISLSTNDAQTWDGTVTNKITGAIIKNASIKVTFAKKLSGTHNMLKVAQGTVTPINTYFIGQAGDLISENVTGFVEDSLVSLNITSATICAGGSFSATVTASKEKYSLSRNARVSIMQSGKVVELASRTQAEDHVSYNILGDAIYFHIGGQIAPGEYVVSYTDEALTGTPNIVSATIHVIAVGALTYTKIDLSDDNAVVALTMNAPTANAKDKLENLVSAIQLSTDGGVTWTGTTGNCIVAVGFTNIEKTYSTAAVNNMRIEFTSPLSGAKNVIKIPADCIQTGDTKNVEIITHLIDVTKEGDTDDETTGTTPDLIGANMMVNGYEAGYKWSITLWNGYDASDPTANMIESFESCFDAKDLPVVTLSAESYVTKRTATWSGTYSQMQNIPMMWHQWQLSMGNVIVYDSGRLYSNNQLMLTYDGLMSGKNYEIKLTCMTQDGVEVSASQNFGVQYVTLNAAGVVSVSQRNDGSVEFQCRQPDYITGKPSGENYWFTHNSPVDGHTMLSTGADTTISFSSTRDIDMDFSAEDMLIARIHSIRDGELLRYESDDDSFNFSLVHRGLANGLVPNYDLFPNPDLYPDDTKWGEFVYTVNGEVIATLPTPDYSFTWYTLIIKHTSITMYGVTMY